MALEINIPNGPDPVNVEILSIQKVILDLNGTVTVYGVLVDGIKERIKKLQDLGLTVYLLSGDTLGTAPDFANQLGVELIIAKTAEEKAEKARNLGDTANIVAIGNGRIDAELFKICGLSIIVTGQDEGYDIEAHGFAHIGINTINNAIDLLLNPTIITATRRR